MHDAPCDSQTVGSQLNSADQNEKGQTDKQAYRQLVNLPFLAEVYIEDSAYMSSAPYFSDARIFFETLSDVSMLLTESPFRVPVL